MKSWIVLALLTLDIAASGQPALNPRPPVVVDHGASNPAISPDGTNIAVSILGKIWLVPSGGGDARQVSYGVGWDTHPTWSPDGQLLAYAQHLAAGTDIVVRNLATGSSSDVFHSTS